MPLARPDSRSDAFALHELERHQRRREQGIPTLTVLAGPPAAAASLWRRWLDSLHRPTCTALAAREGEVARAWMETLARLRSLEADAADFLGGAAGLAPGELPSRLQGKTAHEREVLLQEFFPLAPDGDSTAACRGLLQPQVTHNSGGPLDAVLGALGGDFLRALAALHGLVPPGRAPALLLTGFGEDGVARAARVAARLCVSLPSLVIALTTDRPSLDAYLHGGESQALAMVREGLIELAAPSAEDLERTLEALGVSRSAPEDGAQDRARSAEERFLFALLESLPSTQGLFELNASPGFRLADRQVEVDLLARRLFIAIELDGYHHFQDPEAYRRDRRKDLALQRHGYVVLRFLAQDVVARLEEILDTISEVISQRREALSQGSSPGEAEHGGTGHFSSR
ncbi:endonuclease domain-containing protein [Archangium sp.]|uniref:endonuclease domain-containing protein n=1 Tax=Archangium sp. TaxID=1872627 RepID=UPI002EDABA5C